MANKLDDVIFDLAKAGSNAAGGVATVVARNFDPSSVIKSMGRGSFFKNINLPEIPLTSSKLFHTGDNLKLLKNVKLDSLIPQDTATLLKGLSKKADDVAAETGDDFARALTKTDVGRDAAALKKLAENTSLTKLKKISDDIEILTKNNADLVGNKSLLKYSDEVVENTTRTSFKNTDEMTDSLKASSGLAAKKADGLDGLAKKADGVVDDLAGEADGKWKTLYKKMDKYNGVVSMAVFAGFMFSRHVNGNAPWSTQEFQEAIGDPVQVGEIDQISYDLDMEAIVRRNVPEQKMSEAESRALLLGIIAASVAFMSA